MVIRGSKKVHHSMCQILWIALVLAISSAGISAAGWQDGTHTIGTVTTGAIKPVFTEVNLVGEASFLSMVDPQILGDGQAMTLYVDNASPGDQLSFDYEIENLGSVPVRYQLEAADYASDIVTVFNQFPEEVLEGNGGSAEGSLTLTVGDNIPEEGTYDLQMQLRFKQAIPD